MRKQVLKKSLIVGIILLFTCSSFASSISEYSDVIIKEKNAVEEFCEPQEKVVVSCSTYGLPINSSREIEMSYSEAEELFEKINKLAKEIAYTPSSDEIEKLKKDLILDAKQYNLLTKGFSLESLQPSSFPQLDMRNPKKCITPVIGNRGTASICNFVTTGSGMQFPIIILPRLIPILLTPIPRVFLHWSANEGFTSCGSYLTGTGFMAEGMQRGTALGFWGIGFSVFLPPVMAYGFIGYALFATCTAEEIEPWPPNYAPEVSAVSPVEEAENVAISTSELSFQISDRNGDKMDYIVTTDPDIGSGSENNKPGGTYSIPISGLEGTEEYTWNVEVSDGHKTVEESFTFTTEKVAPIVSDPDPEDGERYVSIDLPQLSFRLNDLQGDLMDYTVETSPDIGSGSASNVDDGTYSIDISSLDYTTDYAWYVNVTDGKHWKHKEFHFFTEPQMIFNPFDEGWQYRKQITINHSQVADNLSNFPVLIRTVDSDLSDKAQNDGDDLLFMDDIGVATRLCHEIEQYDESSGELTAWVNVSQVSSSSDTYVYMYYGNPCSGNQQLTDLVWDSNYVGVWHFHESPTDSIHDSTTYGNDLTSHGGMTASDLVGGKVGLCLDFDGVNDYLSASDDESLTPSSVTMSMWGFTPDGEGNYKWTVGKVCDDIWGNQDAVSYGLRFVAADDEYVRGLFEDNNNLITNVQHNITIGDTWVYATTTFDSSIDDAHLYFNGNHKDISHRGFNLRYNDADQLWIMASHKSTGSGVNQYALGMVDELRISNIVRSSAWISTSYQNQNDPSSFLIFGPEE